MIKIRRIAVFFLLAAPALAAENEQRLPMWQIDGASNSIFLLGSIHMLREQDHPLPSAIYDAYAEAEALVMELDMDDIDPIAEQAIVTELGLIQDGRQLEDLMGAEQYAQAETLAVQLEIPLHLLKNSEPWYAAINVELIMQMRIGFNPAYGVEMHLAEIAKEDEKEIFGLETTRQQLEFLDNLSAESQREMLIQTMTESLNLADVMDGLVEAWRIGDVEFLESNMLDDFSNYEELHQVIVVDRNVAWVNRIEELLKENDDYLIVVGALHLVGDEGVPRLLAERGHEVVQLSQSAE